MKSKIDWGDILESGSDISAEDILSSPRQNLSAPKVVSHFGITINYPRTKKFLNLDQRGQKILYNKVWFNVCNTLGVPKETAIVFEHCKSGQIHLHGFITIECPKFFVNGAVSDLAKAIHRQMPAKSKDFKEPHMFWEYNRYRCPSHVVQYYDNNNNHSDPKANFESWVDYMKKEQLK